MNQPSIFISCVSTEFRQTRSRIAAILTRLGYTPVIQEIFGTEPGDLRQVLRDKIDGCEGLIQIVGFGYGAEPPIADSNYGRVSYTQFEFLYACEKKKKTWLFFAGDASTRDTPTERLDLPADPGHPDPLAHQSERRVLQLAYRDNRRNDGHLYYDATTDTELELKIERLRDELAELGRAFKLWQNKVLCAFAVGFVLLALIGASVWWFGYIQHREIQAISEQSRHITREKIRAQLLDSVEHTRQGELAIARKAKTWEEREQLRQAAEKAYTGSVSRIDELAASFAEIEGTAGSSRVFDEMARILSEDGVDQALAYAATQRASILEKVKTRVAAASEKNRVDLLPLLKSAQLEAGRNQPGEADILFTDILALEPDWPDARNAFAWSLLQQGMTVEPMMGKLKLKRAVEICQGTLALNQRGKSSQSWATTQNDLGGALREIGIRSDAEEGRKLLQEAVGAYGSALEVRTKADLPQEWATTQNDLGVTLYELGIRSNGEEERKLLQDAVAAYRSALEVRTRVDLPQDWATTQNYLGNALADLGVRSSSGEVGRKLLEDAVAAYRSALEVYTKGDLPQYWAHTQMDLGTVLYDLGIHSGAGESRKLLENAVAAYRSALEVYTKADLPQYWAMTQSNLGGALSDLGTRSNAEEGRKLLHDAVDAFRSALEVFSKANLPYKWAVTQNDLGGVLEDLGTRSGMEESRKLLRDAVAAFRSALEVRTRVDLPQDWAQTQDNLGGALQELGVRSGTEEGRKLLQDAVAAYRSALEVYTKADLPQDWAMTENDLGTGLVELGARGGAGEARKLLQDALVSYRSALEVRTKVDLPQDWAQTQSNLGRALKELAKRGAAEERRKLLEDALVAYRSALEVRTKTDLPQDWAQTEDDLGSALKELGTTNPGEGRKLLQDAITAFRCALEVRTRANLPQDWAQTENNLSDALWMLGNQLEGEEGLKRQLESVELLRNVVSYQPNDLSRCRLASELGGLAFNLILNGRFQEAQTRCEEAQRLANEIGGDVEKMDRDNLMLIQQSLAHSLLFQGHYNEALAIYHTNWDRPLFGKTFGEVTLENFAAFDKEGLNNPDFVRMKQALGDLHSEASSP